ncbi:hypothetical protein, partial [Leptospira kirschneri]|uniref:hypothetical protein n=1 Tax=Leptospira kirschneri TaxID=29507 RepID=UPI001C400DC6
NLLTRAESPVRLPVASRIRPGFLMSNSRYFSSRSERLSVPKILSAALYPIHVFLGSSLD